MLNYANLVFVGECICLYKKRTFLCRAERKVGVAGHSLTHKAI